MAQSTDSRQVHFGEHAEEALAYSVRLIESQSVDTGYLVSKPRDEPKSSNETVSCSPTLEWEDLTKHKTEDGKGTDCSATILDVIVEEEEEKEDIVESKAEFDNAGSKVNTSKTFPHLSLPGDTFSLRSQDGARFKVNAKLATGRSRLLERLWASGVDELECDEPTLGKTSLKVISTFLETGEIQLSTFSQAALAVHFSVILDSKQLCDAAFRGLGANATPDFAIRWYKLADRFKRTEDFKRAYAYISNNLLQVMRTGGWEQLSCLEVITFLSMNDAVDLYGHSILIALVRWLVATSENLAVSDALIQKILNIGTRAILSDTLKHSLTRELLTCAIRSVQECSSWKTKALKLLLGVFENTSASSLDSHHSEGRLIALLSATVVTEAIPRNAVWEHIGNLIRPRAFLGICRDFGGFVAFGGSEIESSEEPVNIATCGEGWRPFQERQKFANVLGKDGFEVMLTQGFHQSAVPLSLESDIGIAALNKELVALVGGCNDVSGVVLDRVLLNHLGSGEFWALPSLPEPRASCCAQFLRLSSTSYVLVVTGGSNNSHAALCTSFGLLFERSDSETCKPLTKEGLAMDLHGSMQGFCAGFSGRNDQTKTTENITAGLFEHKRETLAKASPSNNSHQFTARSLKGKDDSKGSAAFIGWSWKEEWFELPSLQTPRSAAGSCVVLENKMLVIGGSDVNLRVLPSTECLCLTTVNMTKPWWYINAKLNTPRHSFGLATFPTALSRTVVVAVGGRSKAQTDLASMETLTIDLCESESSGPGSDVLHAGSSISWQQEEPVLNDPRSSFGCTMLGLPERKLVAAGGIGKDAILSSVEVLSLDHIRTFR
mmetsp:Transcript_10463/g.18449  ORF Transcript_10463/g.18449 Transcript_10463/m.18449 type:complete len:835 (+) Transcript_10463:171-2675(+)